MLELNLAIWLCIVPQISKQLRTGVCLQICCSSPSAFPRASRDGVLEAKPIKGTARRHADADADMLAAAALAASEKDQAENLMIVDLLRNDLAASAR